MGPEALHLAFPHLNGDDILSVAYGAGRFFNTALMTGFKAEAPVFRADYGKDRGQRIVCDGNRFASVLLKSAAEVQARIVVNASGPPAAPTVRRAGPDVLVEPLSFPPASLPPWAAPRSTTAPCPG